MCLIFSKLHFYPLHFICEENLSGVVDPFTLLLIKCIPMLSHFQMVMGATRMGQPNVAQNQYLPPGQCPGSSPGLGSGSAGMSQPGAQAAVPPVRTELKTDSMSRTLDSIKYDIEENI